MYKSLEDYKQQYSKYVELAVDLHNYHLAFSTHWGEETGRKLRRTLRNMKKAQYKLSTLSKIAQKDYRAGVRELEKKRKEDEIAWRKANPKPMGRPKGSKNNVKHNGTTQSST